MARFYSRLSYSFGNEDWKTESTALNITPEDRILCITASGDRPLHLLLDNPKEIVSIDANGIQNHLYSLKCAAMKEFEYEDYIAFLGAIPHPDRISSLKRIMKRMEKNARQYWNKNEQKIAKGILYQGSVEKWCQIISTMIRIFRGNKVDRLFAMEDLEQQVEFLQEHWENPLWRKTFDLILHPSLRKLFLKDPGLHSYVDPSIHISSYIYERLHDCLKRHLAKDSLLISLIFKGKVTREAFPPCLTEEGTKIIRSRLDRVSVKTANVIDYLQSVPEKSFDCFSLSDIASYMNKNDFDKLVHAIFRVAKPNARFCIRQFMSAHDFPPELSSAFVRDSLLENHLEQEDRCFVYRFMVGNISKK